MPDFATILQVIPALSAGGAERTTLEMAEAIIAAGGRAIVATEGGRLEGDLEAMGGELIRLPLASKNPFTLRRNRDALVQVIRQEAVDLVHARSRAPAWSALWAARKTGIPFVTTYHGHYGGTSRPKTLYNSVMARGARVIANSAFTAAHVAETHGTDPSRIVTIPRGVDLARFDPTGITAERLAAARAHMSLPEEEAETCIFLLPGRLTSWKGQSLALEAFHRLPQDVRQFARLVIMGDAQGRDAYVTELTDFVSDHFPEGSVRFAGHFSDMPSALLAADVVLAPSSRPEAFGRVAAEALAMGRPAIVSDHGGQREIVEEGVSGHRIPPGDADALARAMASLARMEKPVRDAWGAAGQRHVRDHFTTANLQQQTLNVYRDVLAEHEARP